MPNQPLGPTGLLAQSMTLPAGSQSMSMGGMGVRAQGMAGRKKAGRTLEYLLIGGGGGPGNTGGGGGGAGEYREGVLAIAPGSYAVTIGTGGAVAGGTGGQGALGLASSALGLSAKGGGPGGGCNLGDATINGLSGGSSGGGAAFGPPTNGISLPPSGENTNIGGVGAGAFAVFAAGGGGGGALTPGTAGSAVAAGNGGNGRQSTITGVAVSRAAGGRGGRVSGSTVPSAGTNGIGTGANTGSGGDGESATVGADGVLIVRYLTGVFNCTGGSITTSGLYTIHTFTSSGTLTVA